MKSKSGCWTRWKNKDGEKVKLCKLAGHWGRFMEKVENGKYYKICLHCGNKIYFYDK